MANATVLHVDAGNGLAESIRASLEAVPSIDVVPGDTVTDTRQSLVDADVDCVVGASTLPDGTGLDILQSARKHAPDVGCVLYGDEPPDLEGTSGLLLTEFVPTTTRDAVERVVDLVVVTCVQRTHTSYPVAGGEAIRARVVEQFDVSRERFPSLQTVVDRAASHYDVSQATINVVATREQRFPVCHGPSWDPIPREHSICTYTVLDEGPTVVADVPDDPRFEFVEPLAVLGIGSYAGVALDLGDGPRIATLCIYDERPGWFAGMDTTALESLASDAASIIREGPSNTEVGLR